MSRIQRITSAVTGIVLLLVSAGMIYLGKEGFYLVLALLTISLTAAGLRQLYYYLTMARHMVGGWKILFQGVVILDLGMITLTLSTADIHPRYIMLYLIGVNLFNAAVDILKALEARRLDAPAWEFTLSAGGLELFLAVLGLFFRGAYTKTYMQIGNSVPPLLGRAIAHVIKSYMKGGND